MHTYKQKNFWAKSNKYLFTVIREEIVRKRNLYFSFSNIFLSSILCDGSVLQGVLISP